MYLKNNQINSLTLSMTSGVGIAGLTPAIIVKRTSDSYFASGTGWADVYYENAMSAVSAGDFPGLYKFDITPSGLTTDTYYVRYAVSGAYNVDVYETYGIEQDPYNTLLTVSGNITSSLTSQILYLASSGDDGNKGTIDSKKKTFDAALYGGQIVNVDDDVETTGGAPSDVALFYLKIEGNGTIKTTNKVTKGVTFFNCSVKNVSIEDTDIGIHSTFENVRFLNGANFRSDSHNNKFINCTFENNVSSVANVLQNEFKHCHFQGNLTFAGAGNVNINIIDCDIKGDTLINLSTVGGSFVKNRCFGGVSLSTNFALYHSNVFSASPTNVSASGVNNEQWAKDTTLNVLSGSFLTLDNVVDTVSGVVTVLDNTVDTVSGVVSALSGAMVDVSGDLTTLRDIHTNRLSYDFSATPAKLYVWNDAGTASGYSWDLYKTNGTSKPSIPSEVAVRKNFTVL